MKATLRPGAGMRARTLSVSTRKKMVATSHGCCAGARCAPFWGGSPLLLTLWGGRAAMQKRHLPLRAKRVLKGMGLIGKKGKTAGVPLLVRSVAAQATFPPVKNWYMRLPHTEAQLPGRALRAPTGRQHFSGGLGSKLLPSLERAGERYLVDKFQMPADRDAVCQAGDLDPERLEQP